MNNNFRINKISHRNNIANTVIFCLVIIIAVFFCSCASAGTKSESSSSKLEGQSNNSKCADPYYVSSAKSFDGCSSDTQRADLSKVSMVTEKPIYPADTKEIIIIFSNQDESHDYDFDAYMFDMQKKVNDNW